MGFQQENKCNDILSRWKITFQLSDTKSQHFLELLNDDNKLIEPSYTKGRPWLKYFGHSNLLCVRASRATVNYMPIDKYWLRFFPREEFKYVICKFTCPEITSPCVMGHFEHWRFYFILFFWVYFSFSFLFILKNDEEAHDNKVTWQVTWCDITSLEHDGRI